MTDGLERHDRPRSDRRATILCAVLAVLGLGLGVAAVVADEPAFGLAGGLAAVTLAGVGARLDLERRRAQDALWEARSQTRSMRRRVVQVEAEMSEESSIAGARVATFSDLPDDTDTDEWEIDPVSGLLRERHLPVLLQQAVAAARRKVLPVSVVFWELDGFEDLPTAARDQAVTALGAVAWRALRESDTVFRLRDVVAVAVLIDTAEPGAIIVADRVRQALRESPVGDSLTVSAGIACYPSHALDAAELVSRAGNALDAARESGHSRDHVAVATSE